MLEQNYFLDLNEIPLFNYDKCLNGKIGYVRRNVTIGDESSDFEAWSMIYDQYLEKFGVGRKYSIFLDKMEELTLVNCDIAITWDRFLLNKKRILESEIKQLSKGDKSDLIDQVVIVSKWMRSRVNPKETTAGEFYAMVKMMQQEYERQKGNQNGK